MCVGSWRHPMELSGNSFTGFLPCTFSWLFSSGIFLALFLFCSESKDLTPVGCFFKTGGWEALMGEWRMNRERETEISSSFSLEQLNLSGSSWCQAGLVHCGSSLQLGTMSRSSRIPSPLPSVLWQCQLLALAVSGFLTACPQLTSWLSHPCTINPYIQALLFQILWWFLFSRWILTDRLVSGAGQLWFRARAAQDQQGNTLLEEICWKLLGVQDSEGWACLSRTTSAAAFRETSTGELSREEKLAKNFTQMEASKIPATGENLCQLVQKEPWCSGGAPWITELPRPPWAPCICILSLVSNRTENNVECL